MLSYNEFWYERGIELTADKRTALIVDPPDGRIPYTGEAREGATHPPSQPAQRVRGPLHRPQPVRPLHHGLQRRSADDAGSYNNNVQIMQIPGYVVIYNEMVHTRGFIPIDDDTPRHGLRQWSGESRGHWDGETFVVETYNFITETSLRGSSKDTHVIERFRAWIPTP